jgi:hypothetical protein
MEVVSRESPRLQILTLVSNDSKGTGFRKNSSVTRVGIDTFLADGWGLAVRRQPPG